MVSISAAVWDILAQIDLQQGKTTNPYELRGSTTASTSKKKSSATSCEYASSCPTLKTFKCKQTKRCSRYQRTRASSLVLSEFGRCSISTTRSVFKLEKSLARKLHFCIWKLPLVTRHSGGVACFCFGVVWENGAWGGRGCLKLFVFSCSIWLLFWSLTLTVLQRRTQLVT